MNILQALIEALESLTSNKLRSGLTILGIVIGVAAVIAMLAVGQGAQNSILGSINSIGSNILYVFTGNRQEEIRNPKPITQADANALADPSQAPDIKAVIPMVSGNVSLSANGQDTTTSMTGTTVAYQEVHEYAMLEGDFFTSDQVLGRGSVAVIGVDVADKLFSRRNALVGETIRVNGQPFRIIGVLAGRGGSAFGSQDNTIVVPLTTALSRLVRRNSGSLDMIQFQATDSDHVTQAQEEATEILRTRHRIGLNPDDFTVFSQSDILNTASSITGVLTIFLGGIAGISLLVGGIGIMNIMLVSVTERTREIGLRKALGARKSDILLQFLTESSLLSLLGGVLGIGLGWLISFAVGQIAAASGTAFTPQVGVDAILIAVLFSTAIGLFFGIYPSNRAASLEPVEALRYE
jgi:putative ABC transport system permease protein